MENAERRITLLALPFRGPPNLGRRTSPWIITITRGNKSNNDKDNKKNHTKSSTLAKPPMFLSGVPTVLVLTQAG